VQLLRPEWLWMLLPILLLAWFYWRRQLFSKDWAAVIDARLLPHLLVGKARTKSRWPVLLWLMLGMLTVISLSGPVWKKSALPVFKQQSALVILLDLSSSMDSSDIKPSRLSRARLKLLDLLKMRKEGQTALIAFAATPYTVSPLTDDSETIQSLVNSLTTDIMPAQGSRPDLAIKMAAELFANTSISRGDVLLITDGLSVEAMQKIRQLDLTGLRVSLIGVGTEQGAPIPGLSGGFVKDARGSIVVAQTNHQDLRALAGELGGVYSELSIDDSDLNLYRKFLHNDELAQGHEQTDFKADSWQEEGPWLLLLITPLVALVFRRGIFLSLLLALFLLPATDSVYALDWNSLWKNPDQRAEQALTAGDAQTAAGLFQRPDWKAAAHYKAEQYEQALTELENQQTADSIYNRGNTLARMGRLQEALDSYDELLRQQPEHDDARYNREQVEQALKQQQQQQQQQQNKQQDNSEQQKQDNQQSQQQDSDQPGQQPGQQQGEQSSQDQTANQSQNAEQNEQALKEAQQQAEAESRDQQSESEQQSQSEQQAEQSQDQQTEQKSISEQQQSESLSEQAEAQWLRRIPDDPGGLLRNKFRYQYSRQQQPAREKEPW